jgi:hypothetical protein
MHEQHGEHGSLTGAAELGRDAIDLDFEGAKYANANGGHSGERITPSLSAVPD